MELVRQLVLKKQEQFDNLLEEGFSNPWDLWQAASLAQACLELKGKPALTPEEIAAINLFNRKYQEDGLEKAMNRARIAPDKKGKNLRMQYLSVTAKDRELERVLLQKARKVISVFLYETRPDPDEEPEIEELNLHRKGVWMIASSYYPG